MSRYHCVDAQNAAGFPVAAACEAAGASTSAYYAWAASQAQGPSLAEVAEQRLRIEIGAIHANSDGVYGAPRVIVATPPGWIESSCSLRASAACRATCKRLGLR